MRVKTDNGKTKDVGVTEVTPQNYIVPANEQHLYHTVIEVKKFDSNTGKRLSVPRIQKFGKKTFENGVLSNLKQQGYDVVILHDPNEYLQEQAIRDGELKQAKAAAAAEATARQAAQERAALKAEILEELKQAGIISADSAATDASAETTAKRGRRPAAPTESAATDASAETTAKDSADAEKTEEAK